MIPDPMIDLLAARARLSGFDTPLGTEVLIWLLKSPGRPRPLKDLYLSSRFSEPAIRSFLAHQADLGCVVKFSKDDDGRQRFVLPTPKLMAKVEAYWSLIVKATEPSSGSPLVATERARHYRRPLTQVSSRATNSAMADQPSQLPGIDTPQGMVLLIWLLRNGSKSHPIDELHKANHTSESAMVECIEAFLEQGLAVVELDGHDPSKRLICGTDELRHRARDFIDRFKLISR